MSEAIDNSLALYELGVKAIEQGKGPGELELDLDFDPYLDKAMLDEVMPLLETLHIQKTLDETEYFDWLLKLEKDPLSAGIPGLVLILAAIVIGLYASYQTALFFGFGYSNPAAAFTIAVLCLPVLALLGLPLYALARRYWRWRAWGVRHVQGPALSPRPVRLSIDAG